ncbi:ferredoxin [Aeromicrobium sp. SMF47]|uniref:Ferredoxin n=1 Tax=Aeromicrobium yanjiei TaxID=2662028 RepID=A0A5Q2MEQ8_9ACTN|nr:MULTISPECIES: ferredoxin [Aeromicrobium]MRJ77260.1 ferredoxin [Aeromicrobium yanjiei]MRK01628.1 ferredoxin [Aeromicrobium sp. S22]QGG41607.1 ferredoxin [Aeromicrobium yanjiei]
MKIAVNQDKCSGHARCYAADAELFPLDDLGYSAVTEEEVPAGAEDRARAGAASCPERAIAAI